jgi:hypothetical protein
MGTARAFPTATLLPNGKVLLAGGSNFSGTLRTAELYDPATGDVDSDRQHEHRTRTSYCDTAAQRQGAGDRGAG